MNYVDAHVHVWTDDFAQYPFAKKFESEEAKPRTFFPEEIIEHGRSAGVDRIVLVQMSYYGTDNSYMLHVMREYEGVFGGIGVVDWTERRPDKKMEELAASGVFGFRIYPGARPAEEWLDGAGFERMFAAGAEHNLAICALIGPSALPALARRCEQFAATPVIIDHLCLIGEDGPVREEDIDALCAMAQYPQVKVKVSAFYALGAKKPPYTDLTPMIRRVRDAFGAQRLMWASDCPYQVQGEHTYGPSVELIEGLDFLNAAELQQIMGGTASSFFFRD